MTDHPVSFLISAALLVGTAFVPPPHASPAPATDHAAPPGAPAAGEVLLGVGGSALRPPEFSALTGAEHEIHLVTAKWDEHRMFGWYDVLGDPLAHAADDDYRIMIHVDAATRDGTEGRSPGAVARGDADAYLLDLGRLVNDSRQVVYVRPPGEMNGSWSRWSAFDADGSPRDADHATREYRRAFVRIAEIVRGGPVAAIDRRLAAQGMPALRTRETDLARSGRVALVWNPQAQGSPNVAGNQPIDYYPGPHWVDYVANDIYAQNGHAAWALQDAMYERFAAHPFMVAEYAPWGYDDPGFVRGMFTWAREHPRTVALLYFNGTRGTAFRLADKPATLATYRSEARRLAAD